MPMIVNATQVMIFLLLADAAIVACGLIRKRNMWPFITTYWIILTLKNALDWIRSLAQ